MYERLHHNVSMCIMYDVHISYNRMRA